MGYARTGYARMGLVMCLSHLNQRATKPTPASVVVPVLAHGKGLLASHSQILVPEGRPAVTAAPLYPVAWSRRLLPGFVADDACTLADCSLGLAKGYSLLCAVCSALLHTLPEGSAW